MRAAMEHACADISAKRRPLRAGSGAVPAGRLVPRGPGATAAGTRRLWRRQQRLATRRPLAVGGLWPVTAARGTERRAVAMGTGAAAPRAARPGLVVRARRPPRGGQAEAKGLRRDGERPAVAGLPGRGLPASPRLWGGPRGPPAALSVSVGHPAGSSLPHRGGRAAGKLFGERWLFFPPLSLARRKKKGEARCS